MRGYLKSYNQVSLESEITVASPHRIIQIMLTSAIEKLKESIIAIETEEIETKGLLLSKVIGIISGLNNSLDMEQGGDISNNLKALYEFSMEQLSKANLHNDIITIENVIEILKNLKEGWDAIPLEQHYLSASSEVN